MYIAVVCYTISDDNKRNDFSRELIRQGFELQADQSTLVYPISKVGDVFDASKFLDWLKEWAKNEKWEKGDFVLIYFLDKITNKSNFYTIRKGNFRIK